MATAAASGGLNCGAASAGFLRPPAEPEELARAARTLAKEIAESRLDARDGSITWLRPNRSQAAEAPELVPAGPHLYEGLPGIAVFFAALARVESDDAYRDLSLEIVAPWRLLLQRLAAQRERARKMRLEIGGLVGLSSFVYSLLTLGRILERPELFAEAHQVAGLITPEHISGDRRLDVVSGAPGAVLALLLLDQWHPGPTASGQTPLALAEECAAHLLQWQAERPDGSTAWITDPQHPPLTGFAHGSTGIICALLKLHARTGRRELLAAARRGLQFERSTFSPEHEDWIDQTSPRLRFLNQWCFGAPGITLARLMTLDLLADEAVPAEVEAGLKVTSGPALSRLDHLCCGDMGRVEVLIYSSQKLGRPDLFAAAVEIARRVLARKEQRGKFHGLVASAHRDPSLFAGEAGIGYTLLRLAYPHELPCLLALE
jgi:type 2 lantibiotic biosynthesis protein LanM